MEIRDLSNSLAAIYGYAKSSIDSVPLAGTKGLISEINSSQAIDSTKNITPAIDGTKLSMGTGLSYYDVLDLSEVSVKLAREISKFKQDSQIKTGFTDEELFASVPEISDGLIETIIEAGKALEKPDETYDDLAWGMLVTIGNQVGLTDPDALMAVSMGDLAMYFDEKHHKTKDVFEILGSLDQNGNTVKVYEQAEDIWKDIFLTDENGEFIRGNGGAVMRNIDFERTQSTVGYLTQFSASGNSKNVKLSDADPGTMFTYALALESGDSFAFGQRLRSSSFGGNIVGPRYSRNFYHTQMSSITDSNEKIVEYKRALATAYRGFKYNDNIYWETQGKQHDEMIGVLKRGDEKWVAYKPFQGDGIYEYTPRVRVYNSGE